MINRNSDKMKELRAGLIVYVGGKPIGEITESPTEGRFMVKRYDSEWAVDLTFFVWLNGDEMEIREG